MAAIIKTNTNGVTTRVATSPLAQTLADVAEASLVDLPLATMRRLLGRADDLDMNLVGWKAYDGVISITNQANDALLSSPRLAAALSRASELALQWQRVSQSIAGAFFATLWPNVGLPTAKEIDALKAEVHGMREELRATRSAARTALSAPDGRSTMQRNGPAIGDSRHGHGWSEWSPTQALLETGDVRN